MTAGRPRQRQRRAAGDGIGNLREATHGEQQQNKKTYRNNTSGFPGVSPHKQSGKWRSEIRVAGRHIVNGFFDTRPERLRGLSRRASVITAVRAGIARLERSGGCGGGGMVVRAPPLARNRLTPVIIAAIWVLGSAL